MANANEEVAAPAPVPPPIQLNIPLPTSLILTGNLSTNWKKFKRMWTNYEVASRLEHQNNKIRVATLMTCIGSEAVDVCDGLEFQSEEERNDIGIVLQKLERFCIGETSETYERYCFNKRSQQQGETIENYVANLRTLAKTCNFGNLEDSLIRDRIVCGVIDNGLRRRLLQDSKLNLKTCTDMCRAFESTTVHLKVIADDASTTAEVHAVRSKKDNFKSTYSPSETSSKSQALKSCKFCGNKHKFKKGLCPAWGKSCKKCGGMNHFAVKCKSKNSIHSVGDVQSHESDSDNTSQLNSVYTVNDENTALNKIYATMMLKGKHIKFQVDSGATVNALSAKDYVLYTNDVSLKNLKSSTCVLSMYNKAKVKPVGEINLKIINPKNSNVYHGNFMILKEPCIPVLGAPAVQEMNLITVNTENMLQVESHVPTCGDRVRKSFDEFKSMSINDIFEEFNDVFTGVGKLPGKLKLEIDESVPSVQLPVRKIPLSLEDKVDKELDHLVKLGIIEPIDVPTDWVSSMVVVSKSDGDIRICIDPKPLNKALKRNHYPMPTIEDVLPKLRDAKLFTIADVKSGYWHVELDDESSKLTCFGTNKGRYIWKRLPFGLSIASEEFQRRLINALSGLDGVYCVADDILIVGSGENYKDTMMKRFHELLKRCRATGITLNKSKLKFMQEEVTYLGHVISKDGLRPDPVKVEAIRNMPAPTDKQGAHRIIATTNFLQRFAPNLSDVTTPIRNLLKKESCFIWDPVLQGKSFEKIKNIISSAPVLKYFDDKCPTVLQCDSSSTGLGCCLMQNNQPVAYASRALTQSECNYAQIEKELLAIVFALEKFEHYCYGRKVTIQSDHKPLEVITKKSLVSVPKRLQRMMLRLQKFDYDVKYKKGTEIVLADTLSRAYLPKVDKSCENNDLLFSIDLDPAQYRHCVSEKTWNLLQDGTENDAELQKLLQFVNNGWPTSIKKVPHELRCYFNIRDEIVSHNKLIFKGDRIIIPRNCRNFMLTRIHASHIGIQGCIRRAKESIFWPNMNKDIYDTVSRCDVCLKYQTKQQQEPLISYPVPNRPWEIVSSDLFELKGINYLITVDHYSNYSELDCLESSTSSAAVIRKLKSQFARHGIPDCFISDNGPQYTSDQFINFAKQYEFKHITSSPNYPQSNGKAENTVRTIKNLMIKAIESNQDFCLSLLAWRNTPSEGVPGSPAQRLFGRRTKTLLPQSSSLLMPEIKTNVNKSLTNRKEKQKKLYDKKSKNLKEINKDEIVRIIPQSNKKQWRKAKVLDKVNVRSYKVQTEDGGVYRRNRRHLRKSRKPENFMERPIFLRSNEVDPKIVNDQNVDYEINDNEPEIINHQPRIVNHQLRSERPKRIRRTPTYLSDYVTG